MRKNSKLQTPSSREAPNLKPQTGWDKGSSYGLAVHVGDGDDMIRTIGKLLFSVTKHPGQPARSQAAGPAHQRPSRRTALLGFEVWCFSGAWCLELGVWTLLPRLSPNQFTLSPSF
jgi:hypothetical protein